MNLEFELTEIRTNNKSIVYEIKRQGLSVGLITLDEPYNEKAARAKQMVLK